MHINGIKINTPRTDAMREARNLGNITVHDPVPAEFAERLEFECQRAAADAEEFRKLARERAAIIAEMQQTIANPA